MKRFSLPAALSLSALLLGGVAAYAQMPPAPPAAAAPVATDTPAKNQNRVRGKITAADTAAKTVTLSRKKGSVTLSVPDGTRIFKPGDAKGAPTGTFADLLIDKSINARTDGNTDAPVASEIRIQGPRGAGKGRRAKKGGDAPGAVMTPAPATPAPATPAPATPAPATP